jgi:formylglycine-generating enzyme required for sulfatase activity/tRNA A-37 threonylcarbamoyl transferase component Bud32
MSVLTTDQFLAAIRESNLLDAGKMAEATTMARTAETPQVLANEIPRRGWLTQFQCREIYRGRGRELTFGPYVLLDLLGEGGMGRVFKAYHSRVGREVALKVIRKEKITKPTILQRFHQEIQAAAKLNHQHVVRALDADAIDGVHFFEMEYVEGTDLTKLVQANGPLPVPVACDYIRQAALGLQHAYEQGLVHRDVKPSNLLVTPRHQVKVLDLGLALLKGAAVADGANRITQQGLVLGTPDFVAPEQAQNPVGVDIRADVYALGATLFYLLTGRVPFPGESQTDKLIQHITAPPPSVRVLRPDAPPALDSVIQWMMAKRPEDRPQTPAQAAAALVPYCPLAVGSGAVGVPLPVPGYAPPPGYPVLPTAGNPFAFESPGGRVTMPATPGVEGGPPELPRPIAVPKPPSSSLYSKLAVLAAVLVFGGCGVGVVSYILYTSITVPPLPETFTNSAGMEMVRLSGGSFVMGSPDDEPGRSAEEGPTGEVTLTGPFYIAATEVTQAQYLQLIGTSPAKHPRQQRKPGVVPVDSVTWEEAAEYCRRLTRADGNLRAGWAYRLPTEAEWEYACRAGKATPFWSGEKLVLGRHAFFDLEESQSDTPVLGEADLSRPPIGKLDLVRPHPVKSTEANAFGLYDLHGNVREWCADYHDPKGYQDRPAVDPTGPAAGDWRVVRGGSWKEPARACRSAARQGLSPTTRADDVGFRVVFAPVR